MTNEELAREFLVFVGIVLVLSVVGAGIGIAMARYLFGVG